MPSSPPRRLLAIARALVAIGMAMSIGLPLWLWSGSEAAQAVLTEAASVYRGAGAIGPSQRAWGLLACAPLTLIGMAALVCLWRLLDEYAGGRALEAPALVQLRRFAWLWLALVLAQPLVQAAWSVILTLPAPAGQRLLVLSVSSHDYLQLLPACVVLLVAHVMHDAVAAVEDSRAIV